MERVGRHGEQWNERIGLAARAKDGAGWVRAPQRPDPMRAVRGRGGSLTAARRSDAPAVRPLHGLVSTLPDGALHGSITPLYTYCSAPPRFPLPLSVRSLAQIPVCSPFVLISLASRLTKTSCSTLPGSSASPQSATHSRSAASASHSSAASRIQAASAACLRRRVRVCGLGFLLRCMHRRYS